VSVKHVSDTISNYLFVDGHVKSMRPIDTNPTDQYSTNMWLANRP